MCGRYTLTVTLEDLEELLPGWSAPQELLAPRYNVAPTQPVVVALNDGRREVTTAKWGLVPWWADDPSIGSRLINARAEGAAEKPAFREALQRRRCLVIADGFYEWRKEPASPARAPVRQGALDFGDGTPEPAAPARRGKLRKQPVLVRRPDGKPFAFAGLWDEWRPRGSAEPPLRTCTILTCEPSAEIAGLHDRMPVILPREAHAAWLDPAARTAEQVAPLLVPYRGALTLREVSPAVNDVAHEGPECVEPLAARDE